MEIYITVILFLVVVCGLLWYRGNSKSSKLKKVLSFYKIKPGDKAILPNYSLTFTPTNGKETDFRVTYELEVLEISDERVKVKVIDISSQSSHGNDPSQRSSILSIIDNNWIQKSQIELITTKNINEIRDEKLEEILK